MVRPSQEQQTAALSDAESLAIGDGTSVDGDEGIDFDDGLGGGVADPPIVEIVEVVTASGSAVEIDFNVASWWDITLTASCTLTIVNPPATGLVGLLSIILRQGGSGSYTVTWPAEVEWPDTDGTDGGAAPTLWTVVGARNLIQIITEDGGTSYGGSYDGGSGSALEIKDEGSTLTSVATSIDFVGSGVTATAVGDAVTVTVTSGSTTSSDISAMGFVGQLLISSTPSNPIVFGDVMLLSDGTDFVYASIP